VGLPTVKAILANWIAPGLLDHYLAKAGYSGQLTDEPTASDAPSNLFASVDGDYAAHGRFDDQSRHHSWEMFIDRHKAVAFGVAGIGLALAVHQAAKRLKT
jgi:hypothetical protein